MKKRLALLLALVLILSSFVGCQGDSGQTSGNTDTGSDTIKIGWIGALTGDAAVFGKAESQTLIMLAEDLNANGGVLGKKVEIIPYDTRGDVAEAVNAVQRLTTQDKVVAILGPNASDQSIAIANTLEKAKVPHIATVATNPKVTVGEDGKVKPFSFRVCFIDPYEGGVAGRYAYEKLGFKKAAILYDVSSDYSQGLTQYFEETFTKLGGEIVAKEGFKAGDVDFRPQLTKIKEAAPDVIFMPYFYKEVALSAKQARENGITAVFMGGDAWQSAQLMEMAQNEVQGSYVVNHLDFNDPSIKPFGEKYSKRWNGDKPELNTYLGSDAFTLLIKAIEKAGVADPEKVAVAITEVEFEGVTGKIKIDPNTHNPVGKEAVMTIIEGDQYTFLERYAAELEK